MQAMDATPKRLSCDRCHSQKLRCPRQSSDGAKGCSRCLRRGVECVYSMPLPKGRPRTNRSSPTNVGTIEPAWPSSAQPNLAPNPASTPISTSSGGLGATANTDAIKTPLPEAHADLFNGGFNETENMMHDIINTSAFSPPEWNDALMDWPVILPQSFQESMPGTGHSIPTSLPTHRALADATLQQSGGINMKMPPGNVFHLPQPPADRVNTHRYDSGGEDDMDLLPMGYIGPESSLRPRFVENGFWALVHGQEPLCDKFLDTAHGSRSRTQGYDETDGLAKLIKDIPPKAVCNALLYSFLIGVRPLCPLVHVPTFRKEYNAFWRWHECERSDALTSDWLLDDPTFIPLLFSVLFCGAVAASPSFWSGAKPLAGLDIEDTVEQLRKGYLKGLVCCQDTSHPNINTLVASLFGRSCSKPPNKAFEDQLFINKIVRSAQSLGLHRGKGSATRNTVAREIQRRIWWHVVYLDTKCSLRWGSQTCCGIEGSQWNIQMVSEVSDEAMSDFQPRFLASVPTPNSARTSVFMLLATGHYETIRFMHALLNRVNSCHSFNQEDLNLHMDAFKKLHIKINALINRMPAQGVPEKGFVPHRLATASTLTHESLYSDQSEEPSVFISWARMTLTLLMTGSLLGLQKVFLGHPSLTAEQSEKLWESTFKLSMNFIRHLLQIMRVPAFSPYFWFFTADISILQSIFIILSYLNHNPSSPDAQISRYFVDEAFDILETSDSRGGNFAAQNAEGPPEPAMSDNNPAAVWRLLKAMRLKIDTPASQVSTPPDYLQSFHNTRVSIANSNHSSTSGPVNISLSQQSQHTSTASLFSMNSCQQTLETDSRASLTTEDISMGFDFPPISPYTGNVVGRAPPWEQETCLEISDLDSWSSIIMQGSEDLLTVEDLQSTSSWR